MVIGADDQILALIAENLDISRGIAIPVLIPLEGEVHIEGGILDLRDETPAGMTAEGVEVPDLVHQEEMILDLQEEEPINLQEELINLREEPINLREELINLLDLVLPEGVKLLKRQMMISKFRINFIEYSCTL